MTSAAINFQCHKLIAKVNKQMNSDFKYFICNQYGETVAKLEMIKNASCLHFLAHLLNICRKFEVLISQGSVATCLREVGNIVWVL